ncbi:MAG: CarD family transcriptional regulator, partial [Desulfuromonadales bacterium]|nr:CarD family transcriptional regulator [Desulfuromonadales bacterium]
MIVSANLPSCSAACWSSKAKAVMLSHRPGDRRECVISQCSECRGSDRKGLSWKQTREDSGLSLTEDSLCANIPVSMGEMNLMFKIGDRAVYPAQGVGVVEKIESREFCGQTHDFYILRIIDNDMTIMVPVGNARQVGLRT